MSSFDSEKTRYAETFSVRLTYLSNKKVDETHSKGSEGVEPSNVAPVCLCYVSKVVKTRVSPSNHHQSASAPSRPLMRCESDLAILRIGSMAGGLMLHRYKRCIIGGEGIIVERRELHGHIEEYFFVHMPYLMLLFSCFCARTCMV